MFGTVDVAAGNVVDLAQYQFWGVMIAMVIVMPFMVWMVLKYNGSSHVHMIDRLALPMDGMKHSIDNLSQQLAANTASMDSMLKNISVKVDEVSEDVEDLKDDVHGVAETVKEHGVILEDHSAQLAKRGRGRKQSKTPPRN